MELGEVSRKGQIQRKELNKNQKQKAKNKSKNNNHK